jgi:hypothetical protein
MADMAGRPEQDHVAQIGKGCTRRPNEATEPRVTRADEPQTTRNATSPAMA